MDKLFENIYKGFFLRDLLSYLFPGSLIVLTAYFTNVNFFYNSFLKDYQEAINILFLNKDKELSISAYLILIFICYTVGASINFIRDRLMFSFLYNTDDNIAWYKVDKRVKCWYKEYKSFSEKKENPHKETVERFAVLFQFSGNIALSIVLCVIMVLFKGTIMLIAIFVLLLIILIVFSIVKFREYITFVKLD